MSHTVKLDIKILNVVALGEAAIKMGGSVIGMGQHHLYSSTHQGFAVTIPTWTYPIVVDNVGNCHYDNFGGHWGSADKLEKLKDLYALAAVEEKCNELGWYFERNPDTNEITISHPDGGSITVKPGGEIDAQCFTGRDCESATLPIEQAMGNRLSQTTKPEMNLTQVQQKQGQE